MRWTLAAAVLLIVTACGDELDTAGPASEPTATPSLCEPAGEQLVADAASGLTIQGGGGTLEAAAVVEIPPPKRNDQGWPTHFLAAEISGPGLEERPPVGVWAVAEGGPIIALDSQAREFSEWGSASAEGSQAAENRDTLAAYEEADIARDCVGS